MRIKVTVKPNAKHEKIEKISDQEYRVSVKASPQENKANEALIEVLADYFSVPKSTITLIHGLHSKTKIVEILLSTKP